MGLATLTSLRGGIGWVTMRLTEPYEQERNARAALRPLLGKSRDHAATVESVWLRSTTCRTGMRIAALTAATATAVAALLHEKIPWPLTALAAITAIGLSVALMMHAVLSGTVKMHLRTLKQEHPARLRQIFTEIRGRAPSICDTVDVVERELFGDE